VVLTTWPAGHPVEAMARAIVEARLAACVHIGPVGISCYRWEGAVELAEERPVAIKTTRERLRALEAHVRGVHPYDVPEWLVLEVGGSEAYLAWLEAAVQE
jgi:periplasmic divalent cation tolerance protein